MRELTSTAFEQAAISISGKITVGGGAVAAGSGVVSKTVQVAAENPDVVVHTIRLTEVSAVVGMTVAVLGLLTNLYFNWHRDRRDKALFDAKMSGRIEDE